MLRNVNVRGAGIEGYKRPLESQFPGLHRGKRESKAERAYPDPRAFGTSSLPTPEHGPRVPTSVTRHFPKSRFFWKQTTGHRWLRGSTFRPKHDTQERGAKDVIRRRGVNLEDPTPPLAPRPKPLPNLQPPRASELGSLSPPCFWPTRKPQGWSLEM